MRRCWRHLAVEQEPDSDRRSEVCSSGWALAAPGTPRGAERRQRPHRLRGLQLVDGQQIADTHSLVHFAGPEGSWISCTRQWPMAGPQRV